MRSARWRNLAEDITGILVFDGFSFYQYLEGPATTLLPCLARIRADTRHTDFVLRHDGILGQRRFHQFSLAYASCEGDMPTDALKHLFGLEAVEAFMELQPSLDLEP